MFSLSGLILFTLPKPYHFSTVHRLFIYENLSKTLVFPRLLLACLDRCQDLQQLRKYCFFSCFILASFFSAAFFRAAETADKEKGCADFLF